MKIIYFIAFIFLIQSCTKHTEQKEQAVSAESELPDMSIFHLPATWTTQDGEKITLRELQGNVLVMVMIYTSCQAACPRLVADMRNIEAKISKKISKDVKLILVSIDPETDTPERLKAFAIENQMDGKPWLFLRGSVEDTREFANVLAVKYKQITPMDFSHSNIISVFNEKGVLVHQQEGLGVDNQETIEKIIALAK